MNPSLSRSDIMKRLWQTPWFIEKMKCRLHKPTINDGLNKWQRFRLKDLDSYRKKKREYAKTPEERARRLKYMQKWRSENRERHNELARESHRRNRHKHLVRNWKAHLKRSFDLDGDIYDLMLKEQSGVCFLCSSPPKNHRLGVDHDHSTGKVRKLLCFKCNSTLGWVEKVGISKIQDYLAIGKR